MIKSFPDIGFGSELLDDSGSISFCDLVSRCESCPLYLDCYNFDDSFVSFVSNDGCNIESL